jgi:hypothetical protein
MSLPFTPKVASSPLPFASLLRPPGAHVALIVASAAALIQSLTDLVESLGHAWIRAETLEELYDRIGAGGYCYVVLSLDIHAKLGADAQASAGETALTLFRRRYPQRNAAGEHLVPIFVATPSMADGVFVWRMHKLGVDELLVTPFDDGGASAMDKVRETLRLSGRDEHAGCRAPKKVAPAKAPNADDDFWGLREPVAPAAPEVSVVLDLDGSQHAGRTLIRIDGKPCWIQDFLFNVLAGLAAARLSDPDGWTTRDKLGVAALKEVASKIHSEVKALLPPGLRLIETGSKRRLRLAVTTEVGAVNGAVLARHSELQATRLAKLSRRRHA